MAKTCICFDMFLDEFKREVTSWRQRWLLVEGGIPQTLVETLDFANPELYAEIYVAVKTGAFYVSCDAFYVPCVNVCCTAKLQ